MSRKIPESKMEEARRPLSTQITPRHHAMLDELYGISMMKNAVVERGIELYYERVASAGLSGGSLWQGEERSADE